MKLSANQTKALDYITNHPEGVDPTDMKHLFEGDEKRARSVAHQLWKKDRVIKKPFRQKESRYPLGMVTVKRVRYFPLEVQP